MRNFLCLLFLFFASWVNAQFEGTNLLPVKIDKKWGLINIDGTLVLEPKYDLIGEKFGSNRMALFGMNARYIIVQLDNKLGLINSDGVEVLEPLYDEIVDSFADSIFTVIQDGELLVVNNKGTTIFDGKYEEIIPVPRFSNYFIVKEKGKYGLLKEGEGYLIPTEYEYLAVNKNGQPYLNYWTKESKEIKKFGLISFENKKILPPEYAHIKIISPNHFLVKQEFYELLDSDNNVIISTDAQWTQAKVISNSFISLVSSYQKKGKIFSTKSNKYIQTKTKFDGFKKFDRNYLIGQKDGKIGLIDTMGNEIIPPFFKEIQKLEGDSLFRVKQFQWGVFSVTKGIISEMTYDVIYKYNNTFAQVETRGKYGLINKKGKEVVPVKFQNFQFQEEFLKAFEGQSMNFYEVLSEDSLTLIDTYPEVYTIRIGYDEGDSSPNIDPFSVARGAFTRRTNGRGIKKTPDYSLIDNSDVEWYTDWGLWGLRRKSNKEMLIKPQYEFVKKLPFTDITIVYSYDDLIPKNELLELMTINPKKGAFGIAAYSHQQEKFVTDFELMGVRVEDFEYDLPHAACMDKDGLFVLLNKKGKIIKPRSNSPISYMGEFYEGKARICVDGKPRGLKKPDEVGNKITNTSGLQRDFKTRYNRFITAPTADIWWIGGTWGFIDTLGRITIPPVYDYVNNFESGTAICKKENFGAIDHNNKPILDFSYKSIKRERNFLKVGEKNRRPVFYNDLGNAVVDWGYDKFKEFSEGFCAVKSKGKWGMVNEKGEEVIPCENLEVNSFSEGWAGIKDELGWYYVDKDFNITIDFRDTEYVELGNFSEGLCWFKIKRKERFLYGYLDKNGDEVINSVFTKAFDFQQGRARVAANRKTGLIDKSGEFVMPPKKYDLVFPFDENGIAQVRENNMGEYGLINRNGKILTPCIYNKIFTFDNGYAKVITKEGIGFVDTLGNEVITPQYRAVGELSEGLVATQRGFSYLWEYINMDNQLAFKGSFSKAEPFKNGKAIVTLYRGEESENLVIDTNGEPIEIEKKGMILHFSEEKYGFRRFIRDPNGIVTSTYCYYSDSLGVPLFKERKFNRIEPFINNIGVTQNQKTRKWGAINQRGYEIIPDKFNRIFTLPNKMYSAISAELYGLHNAEGKSILPAVFDFIKPVKLDIIRVEQGSKIGYFTTEGIWLWQLQD